MKPVVHELSVTWICYWQVIKIEKITNIKAIEGGARVKKKCEANIKDLPKKQNAFCRTSKFHSIQKLIHFEVPKFSKICYKKKYENIEI